MWHQPISCPVNVNYTIFFPFFSLNVTSIGKYLLNDSIEKFLYSKFHILQFEAYVAIMYIALHIKMRKVSYPNKERMHITCSNSCTKELDISRYVSDNSLRSISQFLESTCCSMDIWAVSPAPVSTSDPCMSASQVQDSFLPLTYIRHSTNPNVDGQGRDHRLNVNAACRNTFVKHIGLHA